MREIELTAGTIEFEDTGGDGPVVVLLHGLAMDGTLWRDVVADLRAGHRCVVPTLPFGSHRRPMRPDADLSLRGHARLVGELVGRLGLRDVTLVQNDLGYAQLIAAERPAWLARLALVSCEAFDNLPPGLPGKGLGIAARVPGGLNALVQPMRIRALRRLPMALGWMAKRPIPDEVVDGWLRPLLAHREIRRDVLRYIRSASAAELDAASRALAGFDRPALVVWAAEDRVMPPEHGRRLAELLPHGRLVEIADSYTLIPEDQPAELARAIRAFVRDPVAVA
jgi:pimeloyl-ACP methyl ester carboxylesterase